MAMSTVVAKESSCRTPRDHANQNTERAKRARSDTPPASSITGARMHGVRYWAFPYRPPTKLGC